MKINLTLNKPAATSFLSSGQVAGLKVKIDGNVVLLKASKSDKGNGVFPLFNRTRGGVGITLDGPFAERFLAATGLESGSHMKLEKTSYNWLVAEAVELGTKPSKIVPTARLWHSKEEIQSKSENAPTRRKAANSGKKTNAPAKVAATATN